MRLFERYFLAITAVFRATLLILRDSELRALTIKPWLFGVALYLFVLIAAFFLFDPFRTLFDNGAQPSSSSVSALFDLFSGIVLFFIATLITVVTILSLLGLFSIKMVNRVFSINNVPVRADTGAVALLRLSGIEFLKFIIFLPVTIIAFVMGFIPALIPLSFILFSWILGAGFIDAALDAAGDSVGSRVWSPVRRLVTTTLFGIPLSAATVIPFGFVLVLPIAAVAGAILRAEGAIGPAKLQNT